MITLVNGDYPIHLNDQLPVPDCTEKDFRKALHDTTANCIINGARLLNPNCKNVSVEVSFQIIDDLIVKTHGTTKTGREIIPDLYERNIYPEYNANEWNVTVVFPVKNYGNGKVEVNNNMELYNILREGIRQSINHKINKRYSIILTSEELDGYLSFTEVILESWEYAEGKYEICCFNVGDDGD